MQERNTKQRLSTRQKKAKVIVAYDRTLGDVSLSCKAVGITRQTFYDWCKKDSKFKEAINEVEESNLDFAESQLKALIKDKCFQAIKYFLDSKGKARGYGNVETQTNVTINNSIASEKLVPKTKTDIDKHNELLDSINFEPKGLN